jgi:hypothetical protein
MLLPVAPEMTFTQLAVRDCQRYGIDREEVEAVVNSPDFEPRTEQDSGDPQTEFTYSVGAIDNGRWIQVTWQQLADRILIRRACVLEDDPR